MEQTTLSIEGMSCGHCVKRVTAALSGVAGVVVEEVAVAKARVSFDPQRTNPAALAKVVENAGYMATTQASAPAARFPMVQGGCGCGCRH